MDKRDNELSLELETNDDAAFEEAALDDELNDSMMAQPLPRKKSKAKLIAGLLVVGVLGAGGYMAYQQMQAGGMQPPMAAVPADVPVAGADPMAQPGADPFAPAGDMAGGLPPAAPFDPNAPVGMMPDGSMPVPPGAPDAVMADGMMPPAEPMPGMDPMAPPAPMMAGPDGAMPPADPMAAFTPPADPSAMPAPMPGDMPPMDMAGQPPVDPMMPPADVAANTVPPAPVVETPPAPVVQEQAPVIETIQPAPVVEAPVMPANAEPPMTAMLRQEVNTLQQRVAELESELKTLRDRPVPAPAAAEAGVSEADFAALKRRVEELAAAPKAAPAPAAPAPVAVAPRMPERAPAAPAASQDQVVPATVRALTRVEQATGGGRATATNPSVAPKPAAPAPAASGATGVNWQLRSAQPGRAWIAQPGTQEMRNVAVGDEVQGLGRILSIAQGADGRWTVRGSMGSVSQ